MRKVILFTLAAFALMSCRSQELIRPGDTLEVAFDKAKAQYDEENWSTAARAFETVVSIGRGTDLGQQAQFLLAESYFNNRRYLLAASEYDRFTTFYPRSEQRELVDFKAALSYYYLSPRYRLDQSYTRQALERLRLFNSRYPNSERMVESSEYITELRNKLAKKQYEAAQFYKRTSRFNAAIVYYNLVLDNYPESRWAEESLVDQIEAYILYADNSVPSSQLGRYESAISSYETYLQLFPSGDNRSRAEDLYDRARREIESIQDDSGSESVAESE
jgi:outer membrane protein assembly factor BamD